MSKRSIFEEVGAEGPAAKATPTPGLIDRGQDRGRGAVRIWLLILGLLVVAMITVGGLTRLTDSGLSITEWKPVTGALPPMSAEGWDSEFAKYQASPQYEHMNAGMTLGEFKSIYWWEWGHRQLGRVMGLVWAAGFVFFLATKRMPPGIARRAAILGVLGGLQGAIGWWMVSSGLVGTMVSVASYRLAVHLGIAFAILGLIAWTMLLLSRPAHALMQARRGKEPKLFSMATGLMHFAMLQILLGALVAGIDAGRTFTDWPLMAGGIFPLDMWGLDPFWTNFFENPGTVQFFHRVSGYLLVIFGLVVWRRSRRSGNGATRAAFSIAAGLLLWQMVLGIMTVLHAAPLPLAIAHQFTAILLWIAIIRARFLAQYPVAQSVRG
ncbi:heme A synthase [Mangrovicoccus algicola]|uniref:Heme A synthase n=1 Tax=Mangrovicoccus algicola TaxID=2771008 RepID=A0A8J7CGE5_9RHOB|nr:heme A synthase [Mangrovicoccus algicola]MBE3637035.1 COX15/CtaA family protein [Mangrovicoccus algicola]